jgi:tRNA A37 threonylcarbamoyladenosine dehydratase
MAENDSAAFQRLALITGQAALDALGRTAVMVVGLGGVGSWCAEALIRSGIGSLTLVDSDLVCVTNINRQAQAFPATVGQPKAAALRDRLAAINPRCAIRALERAFTPETEASFPFDGTEYVIDAIDSLSCKVALIESCAARNITLFSSMGMAQKLDPSRLEYADIWKTHGCPLARLVRSALRRRGFSGHFTAVFSAERLPLRPAASFSCGRGRCLCPPREAASPAPGCASPPPPPDWCASKKVINGSAMPVTAAAGMTLASLVIRSVAARYV